MLLNDYVKRLNEQESQQLLSVEPNLIETDFCICTLNDEQVDRHNVLVKYLNIYTYIYV